MRRAAAHLAGQLLQTHGSGGCEGAARFDVCDTTVHKQVYIPILLDHRRSRFSRVRVCVVDGRMVAVRVHGSRRSREGAGASHTGCLNFEDHVRDHTTADRLSAECDDAITRSTESVPTGEKFLVNPNSVNPDQLISISGVEQRSVLRGGVRRLYRFDTVRSGNT